MKTKHTPETVLKMLQDIKQLLDNNNYNTAYIVKKYPSYSKFRKILYSKGLIKENNYAKRQWVSIPPNIIMAREVLRIFISNTEQEYRYVRRNSNYKNAMEMAKEIRLDGEKWISAVQRACAIMKGEKEKLNSEGGALSMQTFSEGFENKEIKKSVGKPLRELPPADLEEMIEAKNEEIQELNDAYETQQKQIKKYKRQLDIEQMANKSYKQRVENAEKQKTSYIDKLTNNTIQELKNTVEKQKDKIEKLNEGCNIMLSDKNEDIEQLQNTIKELENEIREADNEIENLENRLKVYKAKEIMTKQEIKSDTVINTNNSFPPEPYFYRDLTPQERMGKEPLTSTSSKTFKLFGIPIFTIDNK